MLYVNFSVKPLHFAPKWSISCFQRILAASFCYHTNDKSQSNLRLLLFVYCSNKLVRTNWRKTNLRAPPTSWWSSIVFGLSVCLSVCYCGLSNLVILNRISSKFHILIASIKLWFKFRYGFLSTIDNQDGRQNGHPLSVYIHSLLWSF